MKLSDCLHCWRDNKPSWSVSRSSRVVSPRCLILKHIHPCWMSYIRRHLIFSQALWMPDVVLASNIYMDCHKIFWSWERPFSKMNWLRKPHGAHIIPTMCVLQMVKKGGLTSTPLKPQAKIRKDNTLLPQQERASVNTVNLTVYPPKYEMRMAAQEFCKLCEPKINKLKDGYCATGNLIFHSWLDNIRVHVEDQNLTEREAIQLVKDFIAEHAQNEVSSTWEWLKRTNKLLKVLCNI